MHVLLIVLGLLLLLFGGGCTLLAGGLVVSDPSSLGDGLPLILTIWLPLGLAPLVGGFLLLRAGLRRDRAKRQPPTPDKS